MNDQGLPSPETLDVIYDATKDSVDEQLRGIDALDNKLGLFFSTATVLIGLPAAAAVRDGIVSGGASRGLFIAAVAAYALSGIAAFFGLWVRRVRRSVNAAELWPLYWSDTPINTKIAIVDGIAESYAHNTGVLTRKVALLKFVQVGTLIEALLVAASLVWSQI